MSALPALSWSCFVYCLFKPTIETHYEKKEKKEIKAWVVFMLFRKAREGHFFCASHKVALFLCSETESRLWIRRVLSGSVLALKHDTHM